LFWSQLQCNERPRGAETTVDDQAADPNGTTCRSDRTGLRVSEPPHEQKHQVHAATADRGDKRPMATVAAELSRRNRPNVRMADATTPLAGIASNEKHDCIGTAVGHEDSSKLGRGVERRRRPVSVAPAAIFAS
jgi:hypothetical protein